MFFSSMHFHRKKSNTTPMKTILQQTNKFNAKRVKDVKEVDGVWIHDNSIQIREQFSFKALELTLWKVQLCTHTHKTNTFFHELFSRLLWAFHNCSVCYCFFSIITLKYLLINSQTTWNTIWYLKWYSQTISNDFKYLLGKSKPRSDRSFSPFQTRSIVMLNINLTSLPLNLMHNQFATNDYISVLIRFTVFLLRFVARLIAAYFHFQRSVCLEYHQRLK